MAFDQATSGPIEAEWVTDQRRWARGWRRMVFPTVFLAWLIQVGAAIAQYCHGAGLVAGFVILAAFCGCYLVAVPTGWTGSERRYLGLVTALAALALAEIPFARDNALIMGIFVCVPVVIKYGTRGLPVVGAFTALAVLLPVVVRSWHETIGTSVQNGTLIAIPLTGLAMFGFGRVIMGSNMLAEARIEVARLAAENERNRIARDLHDLLGHSLTTITVKADLADRLVAHDLDEAAKEIREVAALSRRALGDVRAAVANFREVTLAGELASGRELLRAAGIVAELPHAAEIVDDATQELFGWVVREGLTNVVRHSKARTCQVRISPRAIEVVDDGIGGSPRSGNGLAGLTERVAALGGSLQVGPLQPRGWRLAVSLASAPT